jgi:hypothetical protein
MSESRSEPDAPPISDGRNSGIQSQKGRMEEQPEKEAHASPLGEASVESRYVVPPTLSESLIKSYRLRRVCTQAGAMPHG